MQIRTCLRAACASTAIAVAAITASATASAAPVTAPPPPVPPGGLVTSFLNNQLVYCSIICPLAVRTAETVAITAGQAPSTFSTAMQAGDPTKAIGITAASITGPTDAEAEQTIVADGTVVAPRALNAFEVGVVGLLDVGPAAAGGPSAIADAVQTARQDTYTAMNLPIEPNPPPTVMPHGAAQVATVAAIDVGAAVAFPAFNDVLSGAFHTPDAMAQELAATGDPARAMAAGADSVTAAGKAASGVVADAIANAADKIGVATGGSPAR
ncbi:hypothetical protein [Antrihabitans cavernicola]|uniref:Uncharacterized protein n=1 Tax=Antrihabitans cavernicola TaxID=2495913 RepID=A0A5A7S6P1_9NOCA|nr:hypothetical protein [Spelaeibacter cavernicola]KAA0020023.1 hypothetical protein FOY51_21915 [Spelaeibacter cavernicola]